MSYPILYSLRNCPYAMRARIAIFKAKKTIILRDLVLSNKPEEMLIASPKGTVPVLVLENHLVIEESLEVMLWVLAQNDPDNLLLQYNNEQNTLDSALDGSLDSSLSNSFNNPSVHSSILPEMLRFITIFDHEFKTCLENYKCAKRYHESNIVACRQACEVYIEDLEKRLNNHSCLFDERESLVDIALLPFIRQFARIERQWYLQSAYPKVRQWLNRYLQSPMFTKVMAKQPLWLEAREEVFIGRH